MHLDDNRLYFWNGSAWVDASPAPAQGIGNAAYHWQGGGGYAQAGGIIDVLADSIPAANVNRWCFIKGTVSLSSPLYGQGVGDDPVVGYVDLLVNDGSQGHARFGAPSAAGHLASGGRRTNRWSSAAPSGAFHIPAGQTFSIKLRMTVFEGVANAEAVYMDALVVAAG